MKKFDKDLLKSHIENFKYVSFLRKTIDSNWVDGFPISFSSKLVQILYTWDFTIDGYKVFRLKDISDLICGEKEEIFKIIVENENSKNELIRLNELVLQDWKTLFSYFLKNQSIIIVENEKIEGEFYIGKVVDTADTTFKMRNFNSLGEWDEKVYDLIYDDISCVTFGDRYSTMYIKYFLNSPTKTSLMNNDERDCKENQ